MYTLSWHQEGEANVNQAHNRREPHAISKDSSIDYSLSHKNITLVDIPVREAYRKLFDAAVDEYNDRARKSRQISDYYVHLGKSNKQRVYEAIIQLGSKAEGSPEQAVRVFKKYVADWKRRNPNMKLIGAYIHADETTVHMHIDYIPVAVCNRGMWIQNSLTRALASQGFKTCKQGDRQVTAQIQWEQAERDCIREICRNMDIELHEQGTGRKRHLSVKEYKDCQEQIRQAKAELTSLENDNIMAMLCRQDLIQSNERIALARVEARTQLSNLHDQVSALSKDLDRIKYLEAFKNCVQIYEPDFCNTVDDFLQDNGLDSANWPDNLYTEQQYIDDEQYIDDDELEL